MENPANSKNLWMEDKKRALFVIYVEAKQKPMKTRFCCLWVNTHLFSIRASVNTSALVFLDTRIANCLTASTTESKNLKNNTKTISVF